MNRDLLVLSQSAQQSPAELERELAQLNTILFDTENWAVFSIANEILDINRHKIIRKAHQMQQILTEKKQKPFVFTCNKN
ncbi:MAG: hypothetical protein V4450_05085 [Bacteroidota bacterium]